MSNEQERRIPPAPRFLHYEGSTVVIDRDNNEEIPMRDWPSRFGSRYRFVSVPQGERQLTDKAAAVVDLDARIETVDDSTKERLRTWRTS